MSRALPLVLAAVMTAGVAGAALLPDSHLGNAPGVAARADSAITPVSPLDWSTAGMYAGRAVAARKAAVAKAAAKAAAQAAAAEQARKDRAAAAERRASRSRSYAPVSYGSPRDIARSQLAARGWADQFGCLDSLWQKESSWSIYASNSSGAYGIPQALPGSKMASVGSDWRTNPATQIRWGLGYIAERYGSPCAAWSHSQSSNWY
jgi:hypothetical protein